MFANSSGKFQVKVQFSLLNGGRKAKFRQFIFKELFFDDVADMVLGSEITITRAFGFEVKSVARQNTS